MADLTTGMHTGIGSSRSVNRRFLACQIFNRTFQGGLNRRSIVLPLPADKRCAVIFYHYAKSGLDLVQNRSGCQGKPAQKIFNIGD